MSTAAERKRERKAELLRAGYSTPAATALAAIDEKAARQAVAEHQGGAGIADGPGRKYLIALLAHALKAGAYPSAPAALAAADVRFIEQRANQLARAVRVRRDELTLHGQEAAIQ